MEKSDCRRSPGMSAGWIGALAFLASFVANPASALTTFALPGVASGGALFYSDVQSSFPQVDWGTLG
jgi:hypothetical protein